MPSRAIAKSKPNAPRPGLRSGSGPPKRSAFQIRREGPARTHVPPLREIRYGRCGCSTTSLNGRVSFRQGDASALPFRDGEFDLVAHNNMIPFFDEVTRVLRPGGRALFAYSSGADTPIYVPPERLRTELERRGFTDLVHIPRGRGTVLVARRP